MDVKMLSQNSFITTRNRFYKSQKQYWKDKQHSSKRCSPSWNFDDGGRKHFPKSPTGFELVEIWWLQRPQQMICITSILMGNVLFMKCDISVTSVSRFVLLPAVSWLGLCGVQYLSINITISCERGKVNENQNRGMNVWLVKLFENPFIWELPKMSIGFPRPSENVSNSSQAC